MKRLLLVIGILALLAGGLWAQSVDFSAFQASFQSFADDVANSLPITASIGLNWSHAYIGQFPHFGVGVSLGGMFLPYETMQPIVDALGVGSSIPQELKTYGLPFPTIAAGARLGGFILPFDMGFKFGMIPEEAKDLFSQNVTADFFLIGGDVRFPVLKGRGLIPTLSVGGGYTFLRGRIGITDVSSGEMIDITALMNGAGYTTYGSEPNSYVLDFADPDLIFSWDTHTIEAKAQASWNLLLFTPHVGLGAAYGISKAGGGLSSSMVYQEDGTPNPDLSDVEDAFAYYGYPIPTVSGLEVISEANGWSFWVYGGTAINIFFIKVDLSAMYNFLNGDYGASVNLRLQL
jgi:hypothetical protein